MAKDVQITQQLLANLGYNPGPIDGSYGGKTKRALIQLYASQDKVFDGELSSNEIDALKTAVASAGISGSDNVNNKRFFTDQSDKNTDYRIHFIYLIDADGTDNQWDINGKMEAEILKMNQKLWTLTGQQQKFKLDYQKDGKLDISFVRLDKKFRQGGWNVNYPDYYLQSLAFNNPKSCTSRMQIIRIEMADKWVVTMAIPLSKKMIATELTLRSTSSYMVMDLLGPALKVKVEAM